MGLADGHQAMSLITTCPACQTQFEVTEAELDARAGQVRCGACQQVFDGRAQLTELVEDVLAEGQDLGATPSLAQPSSPSLSDIPPASPSIEISSDETVLELSTQVQVEQDASALEEDGTLAVNILHQPLALDFPNATAPVIDLSPRMAMSAITEDERSGFVPGFLSKIPIQPKARSLRTKLWLGSVLSVCVLALVGQSMYLFRLPLAERFPPLRPWLVRFCQPLHCDLRWPKNIASLAIDDTDIQEHAERAGVLVFSSVLINHGKATLALPQIELTLTNAEDAPVLSRQFKAQQYLPKGMTAENGIAPAQHIPVRLLLAVDQPAVAGFRASIAYD